MSKQQETWVLAIAGLAGTVILAQGQWGIMDMVVGIIILLILGFARGTGSHSKAFVRAYGALYSLGLVIVIAPISLWILYLFKISNKAIISIGPLDPPVHTGDPFVFVILAHDATLFVLWLIIWFFVHQFIKRWRNGT